MSDLRRKIQTQSLPPIPDIGASLKSVAGASRSGPRKKDYSSLNWDEFYDEKRMIETKDRGMFNFYRKGTEGLLLLLLHGGGYTGLTWACFSEEIGDMLGCQIIAPDLRGHGESIEEDYADFRSDSFLRDIEAIMDAIFLEGHPPTMVIGHSMGGALAAHLASSGCLPCIIGLAVIDVVEGSAMEALQGMKTFLLGRPPNFPTLERAVEWCVKSGTVRNLRSARISMPSQLKSVPISSASSTLHEDDESDDASAESFKSPSSYCWRTDLFKTEPFWAEWFSGLSEKFLSAPVPKLLILAGVNRLDKTLTVGQMQGKFQMVVLPKVGHAVQEDSPFKVAETISAFCIRNKFANAKSNSTQQFCH